MIERLETKSERRLHGQIARAAEERESCLQDSRLSLESGQGKLAIVVSRVLNSHDMYASRGRAPWYFGREAERLEEERAGDHQEVVIRHRATHGDVAQIFADPEVTDVILIGNGTIRSLPVENKRYFDWRDAARAAKYLKQGRIEQRMCGTFPTDMPYHVPLGTFAVSDLTRVIAATGRVVPDQDPLDELFRPVFSSPSDPLGQIKALNETYGGKTPIIIGLDGSEQPPQPAFAR